MRIILWLLVLVLAGVLFLAASGLSHPIADLLSNLHWHILAAAAFFALIALLLRAPVIFLVSCLLGFGAFAETQRFDYVPATVEVGQALAASPSPARRYRLMTFNSLFGARNMDVLVAYLRKTQPDFVFLQEVYKDKRSGLRPVEQDLYPYTHYCDKPLCYSLMLSKHPWKSVKSGVRDFFGLPLIQAEFGGDLSGLKLVNLHAHRPHIDFETQRYQFIGLARFLRPNQSPLIAGGDFNATVFSEPLRIFAKTSRLTHAGGYVTTWPKRPGSGFDYSVPFTQLGLDQFYVNDRIRVHRVLRGPDLGSDHMPMLIEFSIASAARAEK